MAKKVVTHKEYNGVFAASVSQSYEGPLPPPADLVAYKEVLLDAPDKNVGSAFCAC